MRIEPIVASIFVIAMTRDNMNKFKPRITPIGNSKVLIFDIDGCLYDAKCGLLEAEKNKQECLYEKLAVGLDVPKFEDVCYKYGTRREVFYRQFGTSTEEYRSKLDQCAFSEYLSPAPELREYLNSIDIKKWCFTNGHDERAMEILQILGIEKCFDGVICADDYGLEFIVKPKQAAFEYVEELLGIEDSSKVFFFDDCESNVESGIAKGWNSYLVREGESIIKLVKTVLDADNPIEPSVLDKTSYALPVEQ